MIQTGIEPKKILNLIKDNLNLIIVIPAFIGGLWQSVELMRISIPYIRFFSISQIVPDGLVILMFIISIFSLYIIGLFGDVFFFEKKNDEKNTILPPEEYEKYRKKELRKNIIIIILSYTYICYSLIYKKNQIIDSDYLEWTIIFSFLYITLLNRCLNNCYYFAKEKYKKYYKGGNALLIILYYLIILTIYKGVHNIFISPTNNINIENIKKDVNNKFPNTKQELLYFNDKYIFIKIIEKLQKDKTGKIIKHTKEKVYITKIDNLFND